MEFLVLLPVLLLSIVLHEVAHAWVAKTQGDPTAERLGRITLNPIPHLDPMGSVIVPLLLWFGPALLGGSAGGFVFGWAKPVPVDPRNFRDYRKGDILVSLAGVAVNLVLAVVFTGLAVALAAARGGGEAPVLEILQMAAQFGIFINLILAFFNLVPIPPLDGSHVVYHLLPPRLGARYRSFGRYGIAVILLLVFLVPGAFSLVLWPVYRVMEAAQALIGLWA